MDAKEKLLDELEDKVVNGELLNTDLLMRKELQDKFNTPLLLHFLADNWNWDNDITIIRLISESPICSKATALMIFWLAQPYEYTQYTLGSKVPYDNGEFKIIETILNRFKTDEYLETSISYNPKNDMLRDGSFEIDDKMKIAVDGVDTWVHDEYIKKISSYAISELEREIRNCKDIDYLNMIADGLLYFDDACKVGKWITDNPLSNKGTALLLYWRLLLYFQKRGFMPQESMKRFQIVQEVYDKLISNCFPIGIKYSPLNDPKNKSLLKKPKTKWSIPEFMKQPM